MTVVLEPQHSAPLPVGPSRRARAAALGVGALVVLALIGAVAWMLLAVPTVARGSLSQDGEMVVDGDSVSETRLLVPAGGTQVLQSVRNEGRWAVELSAPRTPDLLSEVVGFLPMSARGGLDRTAPPRTTAVVPPGGEAGVVLRVTRGCAPYVTGSSGTADDFALRVSALGRAEDQRVEYRLPVTVVGPHAPGPECSPR